MSTLKIDIVVIVKLFDLDSSCTNNHKHRVEIDKIPSNVNPTTWWAHNFRIWTLIQDLSSKNI